VTLFVMHVSVNNFSSVTGIGLNINYDPAVATFAGIANTYAGVSFGVNSATSGVVKMAWVDLTGSASVSISSGVLVDLKFKYKGGSGAVGFTTSDCSLSNSSGSIAESHIRMEVFFRHQYNADVDDSGSSGSRYR